MNFQITNPLFCIRKTFCLFFRFFFHCLSIWKHTCIESHILPHFFYLPIKKVCQFFHLSVF